jgi:hypothetical protein
MRSKGGDPRAPRATIHLLKEGDPRGPRETIHTVLHAIQGRRSMRSEGGDPREVSTSTEGVDHRAKGRKVTTRFRGDHSCAPREAIHVIKGGHPRARGRPSTRSKGVHPRVPREVFHALQGRLSTRSEGGLPRAPSTCSKGGYPRAPREVFDAFHAFRGR